MTPNNFCPDIYLGNPPRPVQDWIDSHPTAVSYIQEGLVAQWDGIENAGPRMHDPNATC